MPRIVWLIYNSFWWSRTLFAIFHTSVLFKLYLYLLIICIEALLYKYARLPPALFVVLQACELVIASGDPYGFHTRDSLGLHDSGYSSELQFMQRIWTISPQHFIIYLVMWLASYDGLAYGLFVWATARDQIPPDSRHPAAHASDYTKSQFNFADTSWSYPLRLAYWISEGSHTNESGLRGFCKRTLHVLLVYLKLVPCNVAILPTVYQAFLEDLRTSTNWILAWVSSSPSR